MLTLMNARPSLRWRRADNARPVSWLARFGAVALPALSGAFGATVAGAAECVVDPPISYAAVQGCISGSVPGDTVRVGPGLLDLKPDERITVKPVIVLAGAGIGQTVVQSTQGVPILVYVGTDAPHTSASTADDYLVKPFEVRELEARIRTLLHRHRGSVARETTRSPISRSIPRRCE